MAFASAQGLMHRVGQGRILLGWAVAMEGDAAAGVHHIQQGLVVHQDMGIKMGQPYYLSLLAEAFGQAARPEAGLTVLAEALTLVATTEERWWEAELSRLTGALQLQLPIPDVPQAEALFPEGPGRGPPPAGEGVGAARGHEPESALAAPGQAGQGFREEEGTPRMGQCTYKTCRISVCICLEPASAALFHPAAGPRSKALRKPVLSWSCEESLQNYECIPRVQRTDHWQHPAPF